MDIPIVIDKETYKVMKHIYRNQEVKLGDLNRKFGDDAICSALYLCSCYYAAYRDKEGQLTFNPKFTSSDGSIGLTPLGNKYVEDKQEALVKWIVPILISVAAVSISVLSLAISIFMKI